MNDGEVTTVYDVLMGVVGIAQMMFFGLFTRAGVITLASVALVTLAIIGLVA